MAEFSVDLLPIYDIVFKNLFGKTKNKEFAINFLNKILNREENDPIEDIEFIKTQNTPIPVFKDLDKKRKREDNEENNNEDNKKSDINDFGKYGTMDILIKNMTILKNNNDDKGLRFIAKTYANEYINIEIQLENNGNMFKRTLYYASGIIYQSLPRSKPYDIIPKLIMINILNYELFIKDEEKSKYHWKYILREEDTNESDYFKDTINILFIELPKCKDKEVLEKNPWILLLIDPNNEYFKSKTSPEIYKKARNEILNLQKEPGFEELYKRRQKQYTDEISRLKSREEEGIKKGIKKGKKEGIEEGIKIGKKEGIDEGEKKKEIDIIFKLFSKSNSIESIKSLDVVPEDEVEYINVFLNSSDYSIEMLSEELKFDKDKLNEIYKKYYPEPEHENANEKNIKNNNNNNQ